MSEIEQTGAPAPGRPWNNRIRPNVVVALLFAAFAVIELWTPIVHGGYYIPGDFTQLWPITKVAHGPKAPRNPLESDVYDAFGPFLHFDVAQFDSGHLPTWNPYDGNGMPYLADAQTVVVSPFTVPFYFLGYRLALIAAALARLWLLGFFTYLFLVRHRLRVSAAAVGGAIFAYAGYHIVWLDYQTHVSVSATLPVALWSLRVALDHRGDGDNPARERALRSFGLIGTALAVGAMIMDGHPETFTFDFILIVGYALIAVLVENRDRSSRLRWAGRLAGTIVLALGISAIQLLPFLQYTSEGARTAQLAANPASSVAGYRLDTVPLMAFPNLFGAPQLPYHDKAFYERHFPQVNYAEVEGNAVGLLALCLLPLGLVASLRRRNRTIAWFGIGAGVLGSVMLYSRWAGLWWHDLPVVGSALLIRSQDIQLMGIAVLGALGVDWVLRSSVHPQIRNRALGFVVGSFAVMNVVLLLLAQNLRHEVSRLHGSTADTQAALAVVHGNLNFEVLVAEAFGLILVLVTLTPHRTLQVTGAVGMVVLAFLANGGVMQSYNTTVPSSLFYPHTNAVKALTKVVRDTETLDDGSSFPIPETNLWYGLYDVGEYDGIGLQWHDALYNKVFGVKGNTQAERMPRCIEGLQLFGVQWVIGGPGLFIDSTAGALVSTKSIKHQPLYPVIGSNLVGVVDQVITSTGGDERALDKVSSCSFHSDYTAVLDLSPYDAKKAGTLSKPKGSTTLFDSAKVTARTASTLTIRSSTPTGGWLIIRQSWAPGWTATVDGHTSAVVRADVAFQAVHVPAGKHTVYLAYQPASVANGAAISIVSALIAFGLLVVGYVWWRQPSRPVRAATPAVGTSA
jgi:hypothetical protein